ncbi:hypothetical protein MITSMUL_04188 [Mitsuokella multacida DSM 20544]|uniref:Uncharacterized protein n=1 Tax=Mitsuokella multacida DSM 20544 TaxID=500635 RepID=C9KLV4_9FIRM|nr:hypothetical protein MITSMUL_04188 [Mitsuokella multacida DSM 20544]
MRKCAYPSLCQKSLQVRAKKIGLYLNIAARGAKCKKTSAGYHSG